MNILGISAYYHDSAAVIIKDGRIVCAIEEERFSRIKHDNSFPYKAIEFCLRNAGMSNSDIDYVAYYEKPLLKFERILETFIETYPFSLRPFLKGIPEWLDYKIKISKTIKDLGFKKQTLFIPHHFSHASSTFFTSPFRSASILTIDGVGEWQTTGLWSGNDNNLQLLEKLDFPTSLGLLYSTFTAHLGFKINEDEYKLMGLAAYGKPTLLNRIKKIIDVKEDGSFRLDQNYFGFRESLNMYNDKFLKLFGKPRDSEEKITSKHADIAASIQSMTEEIYFKILNHLHKINKSDNLCLSGGVALNALANGKIYEKTPFKKVHVFGAASDSGAALGAALYANFSLINKNNKRSKTAISLYTGSSYENDEIRKKLEPYNLKYKFIDNEKDLIEKTAKFLSKGKIVGWFQERCEYGPRALGNRSILCKPNPRSMKTKMNIIKLREQFRPFAGSILQDEVDKYFDVLEKNLSSPYMTFCFNVKKGKREELAAIVHRDGTCRIQTVNKTNGRYFSLIKRFYEITGIPCVLNTSFNLKGEPIVEKPDQAIEDFMKTKMDYLIIGDFIVSKTNDKE